MTTETTGTVSPEDRGEKNELHSELYELMRKVVLLTVGVAAVAEEEISILMRRMIERGEIAEKDARKLMKEVMERREKILSERRAEAERTHQARRTTSPEVAVLTERIAELTRQIEELKAQQAGKVE